MIEYSLFKAQLITFYVSHQSIFKTSILLAIKVDLQSAMLYVFAIIQVFPKRIFFKYFPCFFFKQ